MIQLLATVLAILSAAGQTLADNQALVVNPPNADAHITTHGSDWLWAVFAVMVATGLGVFAWAMMIPTGQRAFHWIGIAILFTASVAYFSMASNLGSTPVYVEFVRYGSIYSGRSNPYTRQIWYARYIDWVITTPLLLLELLLGTGMPLSGIFATIFFDEVMIIAGLIGSLVVSTYKWGYYVGGCVALFYITWVLIFPARANAKAISADAHRAYLASAGILCFLWLLYPLAWGLADGGNVISPDGEMIFYGILDVLAKPVFLVFHLFQISKVPYESFGLQSGHYSAYASVPATSFPAMSGTGVPASVPAEKQPRKHKKSASTSAPAAASDDAAVARPSESTVV